MEWISVKDRLPKQTRERGTMSNKVLLAMGVHDKQIVFGWYRGWKNKEWVTPDMKPFARQDLITHWMPLPKLPEKEGTVT